MKFKRYLCVFAYLSRHYNHNKGIYIPQRYLLRLSNEFERCFNHSPLATYLNGQ